MAVFFFLILAGLLGAAVWWLQRHQRRQRADVLDRSRELPPLEMTSLPDFTPASPLSAASTPAAPVVAATATSPARLEASVPERASNRPATETASTSPNHWQDQVKRLKDRHELDAALSLCQQQFPKAQAFQQGAIILRLMMKQNLERQQSIDGLLTRLYRCAVLADLFRSGPAPRPADPRQALKALTNHDFPYQQIGHRELKLLSKSDVRLLEQRWGVPQQHQHSEVALGDAWRALCH